MIIKKEASIADITNYKIGGKARVILNCENREDILSALDYIQKEHIDRFFVMGLGTNLLVSDEYFNGAIIRIVRPQNSLISLTLDRYVSTFAGESVDSLIQFAFYNHMIGLEWAGGLPGTVGGGVRGNAGAFGSEIKDTFYQAEILELKNDGTNDILTFSHADMDFAYRNSRIKKDRNHILISCTFILSEANEDGIKAARKKYDEAIEYRRIHHPLEYPSCGSVFKNIAKPEQVEKIISVFPDIAENVEGIWHGKVAMGYLTKRLGFENYRVGNAMISEKHGNYIVNLGGARFLDVKTIIDTIQEKFQNTFGFVPETEVEIVQWSA